MSYSRSDGKAMPALPLEGGCQCGALRYRVSGMPLTFYLCHCRNCQRQSGSAFGESLMLRCEDLTIDGAQEVRWTAGGSGVPVRQTFCGRCGGRLSHQREKSPVLVVKPGTLDDPSWLVPVAEIFTASRQPWLPALPGAAQYPGAPDMERIKGSWADWIARFEEKDR
ncbi:GFA family protein [Martelella soudanensis]|uniref:GFA family protein n=1 Tax=unclassified Martelella TaxID=2629616 RepID=UPI0015DF8E6B|nr:MULTISPECIES: GFA family protein [unclassified Martelella]